MLAVLDCMIEKVGWTSYGSIVHYSLLETDRQSLAPDDPDYNLKDKTCLQLLAQTNDRVGEGAVPT